MGKLVRRKRPRPTRPELSVPRILEWADAFYVAWGHWPQMQSGHRGLPPGESWRLVDHALRNGYRGLSQGSSLARLLAELRGVLNKKGKPPLSHQQIHQWAEAHFRTTSEWPVVDSGPVEGVAGETWYGIHSALRLGRRGLPGGDSLARLLTELPSRRNARTLPPLTVEAILQWAEAFFARRGRWPTRADGPISESDGETWMEVDRTLRQQDRVQAAQDSLQRLLEVERGKPNQDRPYKLTDALILAWADGHFDRTGVWPAARSGPIWEAPGMAWQLVDRSLREGWNGLPGGTSLARLLQQFRPPPGKGCPLSTATTWSVYSHERI